MTTAAELYAQAVAALNRSDWARAHALAARVLAQAPDRAGVQFVAGVAAMYLGQLPAAAEHLQRAMLLDPKRADYPAPLARALTAMRLPRDALQAAVQIGRGVWRGIGGKDVEAPVGAGTL